MRIRRRRQRADDSCRERAPGALPRAPRARFFACVGGSAAAAALHPACALYCRRDFRPSSRESAGPSILSFPAGSERTGSPTEKRIRSTPISMNRHISAGVEKLPARRDPKCFAESVAKLLGLSAPLGERILMRPGRVRARSPVARVDLQARIFSNAPIGSCGYLGGGPPPLAARLQWRSWGKSFEVFLFFCFYLVLCSRHRRPPGTRRDC